MSNEETTKNTKAAKPSILTRFGVSPIAFIVTIIIALVFLPTFILLLGGMMPSMMAYVLDNTKKKSKAKTVAYLNLAGCFIIGMELWTGDNSIDGALGVFLQPINWVIMYGSAMFGWVLIKSLNPFIVSYLRLSYQVQQKNLRKRRKTILQEWGEAVTAVSIKDGFIYDNNVYLDDDEITQDPDENIDFIEEEEEEDSKTEPLRIEQDKSNK